MGNTVSLVEKFYWRWNRLSCMTPAEMSYRARNLVVATVEQAGLLTAKSVSRPDLSQAENLWMTPATGVNAEAYYKAADAILRGKLDVFAQMEAELGHPPRWNRDPLTGKEAPLSFGKTLNYRDPALVGDIKYLWEPNRHLHLVTLAQAYHLSQDARYLEGLVVQLDAWFEQCPYLMGPNWTSSLELGIRLINWSFVWSLIGGLNSPAFAGKDGRAFLRRWLTAIYQHAHFIRGHFSRFSSANNHLIGEAAGLFVATAAWPYWNDFARWQEVAQDILQQEALTQNAPDGVNREQAISYQQFVLDFLLISALAGRARGVEFPAAYWHRMEAMLEYLASIMDSGGHVPMIGDADDGYAVRLSQDEHFCPYRSLLATGAVLFQRGDFKFKAGAMDDKTRWLLGPEAEADFARLSTENASLPVRQSFPDGGYYILGGDFETDREVRAVIDAGPLGYQAIAAHGHADALSFTLSLGGREILIDPGTYAYHTQKRWRNYFRGTSAHNTLRIDWEDQSVIGGNFMWLRKAQVQCKTWRPGDDVDYFQGQHDGYARLPDPVIHERHIRFYKAKHKLVVTDTLRCKEGHLAELFWHFSEECVVTLDQGMVTVRNGPVGVQLRSQAPQIEARLESGTEEPPLGWISRRFDVKQPSTTVVYSVPVSGETQIVTEIDCNFFRGREKPKED